MSDTDLVDADQDRQKIFDWLDPGDTYANHDASMNLHEPGTNQ